jgi:hypothetical protein
MSFPRAASRFGQVSAKHKLSAASTACALISINPECTATPCPRHHASQQQIDLDQEKPLRGSNKQPECARA